MFGDQKLNCGELLWGKESSLFYDLGFVPLNYPLIFSGNGVWTMISMLCHVIRKTSRSEKQFRGSDLPKEIHELNTRT